MIPTDCPDDRVLPGWYGKLSTLGDFAQRRLPPALVSLSDDWLSRAMQASRQQLADAWLDAYLAAPVMRFAWAPGVIDAGWWFGILMPSCDNVGRYFPLLVAQRRAQPPRDRTALDHLEAWYGHVARSAMQTLHEDATLEGFEQALAGAPPWPTRDWSAERATTAVTAVASVKGGSVYALPAPASLPDWLYGLAAESLDIRLAGHSIWWRRDALIGTASARIVTGLPGTSVFTQMLTG